LPTLLSVFALTATLAVVAVALGWRGSDLPAQVFRTELVRRDGFVLWNSQWFGGHAVLTYSVLAPSIATLFGPVALGALSGVISAVVFERILRFSFGAVAWLGALWFALGTIANLIVGRMTFGVGVLFGLLAVSALQRAHPIVAGGCALLSSLCSPLAGLFLALVGVAWACAQPARRGTALAMSASALLPIAVVGLLFSHPGRQPYEMWALIWDVSLAFVVAVAAWRTVPPLRWGALAYAIGAVGCYLVPTAVGGNFSRLGQFLAGPLLACALLRGRRLEHLALFALAIPIAIWQFYPAIDGIAYARTDPSTKRSYYTPLINYLDAADGPIGRVEIPSTYRHWEAAYAAPHMLLARGWERQLDIAYDSIFYEDQLTAATYHSWLTENGVRFVALPDARLDDSSLAEKALLERGTPYLEQVWQNANWRVWRVTDFKGLVSGNAELLRLTPDGFALQMPRAGDVLVRVRATRHWRVRDDAGCAAATDNGWTVLRGLPAGVTEVSQSLNNGTSCPGP
jgi:hypothetical protein